MRSRSRPSWPFCIKIWEVGVYKYWGAFKYFTDMVPSTGGLMPLASSQHVFNQENTAVGAVGHREEKESRFALFCV